LSTILSNGLVIGAIYGLARWDALITDAHPHLFFGFWALSLLCGLYMLVTGINADSIIIARRALGLSRHDEPRPRP